ncbi:MAG TPA: WYL domain-containing protein [Ignavibacteria bacterium]|nr:WYL domain-containing protein [Ignavibacteria bacterium]HMR39738.1 WYL domain-containing protein [Ignavibacteria bacterium]
MENIRGKTQLNFVQLSRIAFIDNELSSGNYPSAKMLADQYQVSAKSIQRTIDFMKTYFNAPIVYDKKIKGYYYSVKNFRLNLLSLNESDLYVLALMQKALKQYTVPFKKDITGLYNKLYYLYNDRINIHLRDIDDVISFKIGSSRKIDIEIFENLKKAVKDYISVDAVYTAGHSGKISHRLLDPYQIINEKGEWYLVAYCHSEKDIKTFSISRFKNAVLSRDKFEIKKDFDVNIYFENSFGIFESDKIYNVKLFFDEQAARYIREKIWHRSQKIKENPDGSLMISLKVNSLEEVKFWILTWGKSCTVISPKKLKDDLKNELVYALKNYK